MWFQILISLTLFVEHLTHLQNVERKMKCKEFEVDERRPRATVTISKTNIKRQFSCRLRRNDNRPPFLWFCFCGVLVFSALTGIAC